MRSFYALHLIVQCSTAEHITRNDCIKCNDLNLRLQRKSYRLPQPCRNIGNGAQCAVNVKGAPAKPQYPLRGSVDDDGGGSLLSHRHIMQPAPWQRKKCPRIW